jgi:F-type H+-transporting ATPase subunit epsilon
MQLRVLLPERVAVDEPVAKVTAEAEDGAFCLLPRHVDFVATLVPGLLAFEDEAGSETLLAVDHGVLVKCGDEVVVSTPRVIGGRPLGELQRAVEDELERLDERERRARSAVVKIEADFVRRLVELEQRPYG